MCSSTFQERILGDVRKLRVEFVATLQIQFQQLYLQNFSKIACQNACYFFFENFQIFTNVISQFVSVSQKSET